MRSDAFIRVTCDLCRDYEEEIQLTATARGGYDERNVDNVLEQYGWRIEAGEDVCPDCAAKIYPEDV